MSLKPVLFFVGPFAISSYAVMLGVAVLFGTWFAWQEARRVKVDFKLVLKLTIYLLPAGLMGSRLAYILLEWRKFFSNPISVFYLWEGGLTFYGAVALGLAVIFWFAYQQRLPWGDLADIVALGGAAAYPVGRIGCFLNGCCYGNPTSLPWGVSFAGELPRHPTQLYATVAGVLIFIALWQKRKQKLFSGYLLWFYLELYAVYRFCLEFFRVLPVTASSLTVGQIASLIVGLFALGVIAWARNNHQKILGRD